MLRMPTSDSLAERRFAFKITHTNRSNGPATSWFSCAIVIALLRNVQRFRPTRVVYGESEQSSGWTRNFENTAAAALDTFEVLMFDVWTNSFDLSGPQQKIETARLLIPEFRLWSCSESMFGHTTMWEMCRPAFDKALPLHFPWVCRLQWCPRIVS